MKKTSLLLILLQITLCWAREVSFDDIFVDDPDLQDHIPKVSHFVFSKLKELSWLEYAAIKSSLVNLGVEKINLWMPIGSNPTGEVWREVLALPGATIRKVEMPTKIYGNNVSVLAHVSDILRLEAVYNEGGIYMDYNLIALRSSDSIIFDPSTRSTVMGRELMGLCNALIMSKAHAPFLRTWMSTYVDFQDADWMSLSVLKPWELAQDGGQDITTLDIGAWFSPTYIDEYNVWLGQSFTEIDSNFGIHMWGTFWRFYPLMTPEAVREIDTPLFCRVRHLFDNVRGDSYVAPDWRLNPNCSFVTMSKLQDQDRMLMGSYNFDQDSSIKMIDGSGNNLHGWAPSGTGQPLDEGVAVREVRKNENAWIPVPGDYDGRTGTIVAEMMLQVDVHGDSNVTFSMLRLADREVQVYCRLLYNTISGKSAIEIDWQHASDEHGAFKHYREIDIAFHDDRYHIFSLAWERRDAGIVTFKVDDIEVMRETVSLYQGALRGHELWLNSVSDDQMDMGLRARLRRLETYGAAHLEHTAAISSPNQTAGRSPVGLNSNSASLLIAAISGLAVGALLAGFICLVRIRRANKRQRSDQWRLEARAAAAGEYEPLTGEAKDVESDSYTD